MRLGARLLAVLLLVGCNEVATPTTAPLTLTVVGRLVWSPGAPGTPVAGVQVCETDEENCATTDPDGKVTLQLPLGETSYTVRKDGYPPYLVPVVHSARGGEYKFNLAFSDQYFVDQHQAMMSDYPMIDTGTVMVGLAVDFPGVTFDLKGATSRAFYSDEEWDWVPVPDLTATTSTGAGGFVEVPPGDNFQVNIRGTAERCAVDQGWPGADVDSIRFPVREKYITWVRASCPLVSP